MSTFYPVEIELDGRKHQGQWALKQGARLCVGGFYGSRTVELGGGDTIALAREVLRDLVIAWRETQPAPAPRVERSAEDHRPFPLTVIVERKPWSGTWTLLGGQVFVSSAYGARRAQVKRSTPERLAERLMKDVVRAWLAGEA